MDAVVIFASLTGNTEEAAEIVASVLEQEYDINVEIYDAMQADAEDFLDFDLCFLGSYTYGIDGILPDEMLDFYDDLGELDLTDKVFGVFGSGDHFYEIFCGAVDTFEEQFIKTGATKAAPSVKFSLAPDEEEDIKQLHELAHGAVRQWKEMNE